MRRSTWIWPCARIWVKPCIWILALALLAPAAAAQEEEEPSGKAKCVNSAKAAESQEKTRYKIVKQGGKTIYVLTDDFVICGKVPRPDVYYGLLNSTINYEWENLHQDFMPKILKSVDGSPF